MTTPDDAERERLQASRPPRRAPWRRLARAIVSLHPADVFVTDTSAAEPPRHERFTYHLVSDPLDPLVDRTDDPAKVRRTLEHGHRVNVVMDGDRFAGRSNIMIRDHREDFTGLRIHLHPHEAWTSDAFTVPEFRRNGVGTFRGRSMQAVLRSEGRTRMYSSIEGWNTASRGLSSKTGAIHVQHVVFARLLRRWGFALPWTIQPRVAPLARRRAGV